MINKILFSLLALFISAPVFAATQALPTLYVEFEYDASFEQYTKEFVLLKDGISSCTLSNVSDRNFTCTTEMENKPSSFVLIAKGLDGVQDSLPSNEFIIDPDDDLFIDLDTPTLINIYIKKSNVTINTGQ